MYPGGACTEAKAKQKNLYNKDPEKTERAKENNGCVYVDWVTIKSPKKYDVKISLPVWQIIVDEQTGFKTSHFFQKKDKMVEPTCALIQIRKQNGMPVQIICMDDAGENKKLQELANGKKLEPGLDLQVYGSRFCRSRSCNFDE